MAKKKTGIKLWLKDKAGFFIIPAIAVFAIVAIILVMLQHC